MANWVNATKLSPQWTTLSILMHFVNQGTRTRWVQSYFCLFNWWRKTFLCGQTNLLNKILLLFSRCKKATKNGHLMWAVQIVKTLAHLINQSSMIRLCDSVHLDHAQSRKVKRSFSIIQSKIIDFLVKIKSPLHVIVDIQRPKQLLASASAYCITSARPGPRVWSCHRCTSLQLFLFIFSRADLIAIEISFNHFQTYSVKH